MPAAPVSTRFHGWWWDEPNVQLDAFVGNGLAGDPVQVASFTRTSILLRETVTASDGVDVTTSPLGLADDISFELGTDDDSVLRHRSTTLAANTALTDVLAGTPVSAASPANSLLVSVVTADGDVAFFVVAAAGANSEEAYRIDASARLNVFNEAAADWDFRVETDATANAFVIDGGLNTVTLFGAANANSSLTVNGTTGAGASRAAASAEGSHLHLAGDQNFTNASGTIAIGSMLSMGAISLTGDNATITFTDAAMIYVAAAITAGTNVSITSTRNYSALMDGGQFRVDSNVQVNNTATFGTTEPTAAVVFQSGTAPAGSITTGGAIFTDGTVMRKIIANGTASNVET